MKLKASEIIEGKKGKNKRIRFYDPPNVLRQKVGRGGIEPSRLERAEALIDNNPVDFQPLAAPILAKLAKAIAAAKEKERADKKVINTITGPVMEMKANSGMFGYALASEIAGVVLNFLENIDEMNQDAFDIIDVHQKTLEAIIKFRLKGDGGREGRALAQELYDACSRYSKKYNISEA